MTNAAVLVFKTQGAAFQALHLAGLRKDLEILELIPMGSLAQLILKGAEEAIYDLVRSLSYAEILRTTVISDWSTRIEKAFYSLESAPVQGGLVFVESEHLGDLFQAAQWALRKNLHIVDLKVPRGSVRWGMLTLTGETIDQNFLDALSPLSCQLNWVQEPSAALKRYFQIET